MDNLKHQLEISLAIKRISCKELARQWEITDTTIWTVASGRGVSVPTRRKIEEFIQEAKEIVPFDYPKKEAA